LDKVKGDPIKSLPGYYPMRNRMVRTRFDALERKFETELPGALQKAAQMSEVGHEAVASMLDDFTAVCVRQVVNTVTELLREFD
jgi:hypothetical protein